MPTAADTANPGAAFAAIDREALRRAGRMVASIEGMWCGSCALAAERVMARCPGVTQASISFAAGSALIRWDPASFNLDDLLSRVERLGYRLVPLIAVDEMERRVDAEVQAVWLRLAVAVFFGMWSMMGSLALYIDSGLAQAPEGWWIALAATVTALPAVTYSAWAFYRAGWRTLIAGVPGMDALVSLGVLASFALTLWQLAERSAAIYVDTATMLVAFLLCGRLIELYARRRNSGAINALRQAVPETARRLDKGGAIVEVPAADIGVGDMVQVYAGERIAVDGTLVEGESDFDRSLVTGESMLVAVRPGDLVEAGCINLSCPIRVRVDQPYGQRFIDRIGIRMLELFGARSAAASQAERFARWLVPFAVALAGAAFLYAYVVAGDIVQAALRALSVLVAACPCAVALALPLAYAASAAAAARHGILFRDPASMEALAGAREVQFDKTGTLTDGKLTVAGVIADRRHKEEVLAWAALAEVGIAHPIARAICHAASGQARAAPCAADGLQGKVQRHGRGVVWHSDDGSHAVVVGAVSWLAEHGVYIPADGPCTTTNVEGTRVDVALDGRWIGALLLQDAVREDARAALTALRDAGLAARLVTGDATAAASRVADAVGLSPERVHAACCPEEKEKIVGYGQRPVVFVGDGVNDALALAAADCGVAVHGASTAAVATAGVVIAEGGLRSVVVAWRHARRTLRVVRQNLLFSMLYNIAVLSLAATGVIPPVAAALAMLASSLTVMANAARLSVVRAT